VLTEKPRWLRLLAASAAGLAVTFAMTVGIDRALSPLSTKTEFWQMIPVFDLAGMSVRSGELLVEPESGVLSPGMGLDHIRSFYHPTYVNKLYYCMAVGKRRCVPLFRRTQDPQHLAALSDNWLRAIVAHPGAYLEHRFVLFKALIGIGEGAPGAFYYSGKAHHAMAKPYPPRRMAAKTLAWFDRQVPTFWFHPWVYILIGCVLLPVTLRHHLRGGTALPVVLVLSALSYMLGLFFTTGSAPYRYTVWTTFGVVLALATFVIPALPSLRWGRRGLGRTPAANVDPEPRPA
jgi:hypothetical protein